MNFIRCICFLAAVGALFFFVGRLLPKRWFRYHRFPYRNRPLEQEGKFYEQFGIKRWKDKVPDMSKMVPQIMMQKQIPLGLEEKKLDLLIQETCVAEFIHTILFFLGFRCLYVWPGLGGIIVSVLYAASNLPFIMIQRYNRPRLVRLAVRRSPSMAVAPAAKRKVVYEGGYEGVYEDVDFQLQCRTRG